MLEYLQLRGESHPSQLTCSQGRAAVASAGVAVQVLPTFYLSKSVDSFQSQIEVPCREKHCFKDICALAVRYFAGLLKLQSAKGQVAQSTQAREPGQHRCASARESLPRWPDA